MLLRGLGAPSSSQASAAQQPSRLFDQGTRTSSAFGSSGRNMSASSVLQVGTSAAASSRKPPGETSGAPTNFLYYGGLRTGAARAVDRPAHQPAGVSTNGGGAPATDGTNYNDAGAPDLSFLRANYPHLVKNTSTAGGATAGGEGHSDKTTPSAAVLLQAAVQHEFGAYQHEVSLLRERLSMYQEELDRLRGGQEAIVEKARRAAVQEKEQVWVKKYEEQELMLKRLQAEQPVNQQLARQLEKTKQQLSRQMIANRELQGEVGRLEQLLHAKEEQIGSYDEKIENLEQKVAEAMKSVKKAFHGYQKEEEKNKKLTQEREAIERQFHRDRSSLLSDIALLQRDADNLRRQSALKGDKDPEPKQLITVLQAQVQSLQTQLLESVKRERAPSGGSNILTVVSSASGTGSGGTAASGGGGSGGPPGRSGTIRPVKPSVQNEAFVLEDKHQNNVAAPSRDASATPMGGRNNLSGLQINQAGKLASSLGAGRSRSVSGGATATMASRGQSGRTSPGLSPKSKANLSNKENMAYLGSIS